MYVGLNVIYTLKIIIDWLTGVCVYRDTDAVGPVSPGGQGHQDMLARSLPV